MKGIVFGKFLPLHQGHELLLTTAAACSSHLKVVVGVDENDPWSFSMRKFWIKNLFQSFNFWDFEILQQNELDINAPKDENGTITDENYWNAWVADTKELLDGWNIDNIFSSDLYGKRIAEIFEWNWYPVDPKREIVPISGSMIRENPFSTWKFVSRWAKQDIFKAAAIIGPESTGKSTLVKQLGQHFDCLTTPEYGRTLAEYKNNDLSEKDFLVILNGQNAQMMSALMSRETSPLLITDTEAITTALYLKKYLPHSELDFMKDAEAQKLDKYILMAPTTKWVDDGLRVQTEEIERWKMFYHYIEILDAQKKDYEIIYEGDYVVRTAKAIEIIKKMF